MKKRRYGLGLSGLVLLLASNSGAGEARSWRVAGGEVSVLVVLKPGGAFHATTSSLEGTVALDEAKPALLAGEISINLPTIDTGISLRNRHLRENYLEVGKGKGFDRAVLSDIHLDSVKSAAFEGRTAFTGLLLLHGVKHEVEGTAEIGRKGSGRSVRAEFRLTMTDFGITPPEYLGVGVADRLLVTVQLTATSSPVAAR
jgi:polyisoprenoid-binding protein YceI